MLIVPAIDIVGGRVVRLQKGDFDHVKVYDLSPVEYAKQWQAQGATLIHVVDLDGAKTGEPKNFDVIKEIIKNVPVNIEVGGGIRTEETIKKYCDAGVERVVLSTKVIEDPGFLLSESIKPYCSRIAVSIDIKKMVSTEVITSGTNAWSQNGDVLMDIPSFIKNVTSVGVTHINFSDISRDGMMMGLDTEKILLFLRMARSVAVSGLYFTYAGGVSSLNDVKGLKRLGSDGVDAVVVGKALYEDKFSLKEAIVLAS